MAKNELTIDLGPGALVLAERVLAKAGLIDCVGEPTAEPAEETKPPVKKRNRRKSTKKAEQVTVDQVRQLASEVMDQLDKETVQAAVADAGLGKLSEMDDEKLTKCHQLLTDLAAGTVATTDDPDTGLGL